MLKKIRHNLGIKIMAVIFAVIVWFVVYMNDNPIETRQLVIPLAVLNEDSLAKDNLRVLNEYNKVTEIFVRGRKADVESVSENDFIAYLDLSQVIDEYTEYIDITDLLYLGERNISTGFSGSGRVGVSIDRVVTGEVPITVIVKGEPAEGFSVVGTVLKPANYIAIDIQSLVQNIDRAVVEIDVNDLRGTETIRKMCMVYDEFGNVINELSNKTAIDVTVNIAKNIPVDIRTQGSPEQDYLMTKAEAEPGEVLITGSEEDLAKINSIATLPLDIGGVAETFKVMAALANPPSGTAFVGTGSVEVEISIEGLFESRIPIRPEQIAIRWGSPGQKIYSIIDNGYSVTVKGRQSILDEITVNGLTPYIDVNAVEDGEVNLPLRFESLGSLQQITFPLITIYVESMRTIEIETDLVTVNGQDAEKYVYAFETETENMQVRGLTEALDTINMQNLRLAVDVSGLEPGKREVPLSINLPEGVTLVRNAAVTVIISDKINE